MSSTQFDSFLALLPSALQLPPIATDDDGGGGTDSQISMYVEAGTYSMLANSALVTAETGSYILTTTFTTVTPIGLTVGSPYPGRVERNEEASYEVPVVSGARYTVSITGLTDNATVRVLGGNSECAVRSLNVSPKDCPLWPQAHCSPSELRAMV
jgi:Zn-dependent protease